MAKMDSVNMWKSGSSGSYENGVGPSDEKAPTAEEELSAEGSSSSSADSQVGGGSTSSTAAPTGPDPAKLKAILDRTSTRDLVVPPVITLINFFFL